MFGGLVDDNAGRASPQLIGECGQSAALVVSVRCVYNEPGEDAVIPLDGTVS